jgi:hypothetical protein
LIRRIGDARGLLVGTDFLHFQDVDAVFLGAEAEGQVLAALGAVGLGSDGALLAKGRDVGFHADLSV